MANLLSNGDRHTMNGVIKIKLIHSDNRQIVLMTIMVALISFKAQDSQMNNRPIEWDMFMPNLWPSIATLPTPAW
jgi:hypothetical protein